MDEWRNIPDNLGDKPVREAACIKSQLLICVGIVVVIFVSILISKIL